ncbi:MAG: hypothetical protein H6738_05730 [Alphaproteobacteria bacterium]|nr:hypothetical protein [Alphaproteobacteria bacterium]MCB9696269.1 hypothetical protein [Alphaproteobacteria bacterium]
MDYNISMSTQAAITGTQLAQERRGAVVRAMAGVMGSMCRCIGMCGQNGCIEPGVSML